MYVVRCFNSAGTAVEIRVSAPSESSACLRAAARLTAEYGGKWYPAYALEVA